MSTIRNWNIQEVNLRDCELIFSPFLSFIGTWSSVSESLLNCIKLLSSYHQRDLVQLISVLREFVFTSYLFIQALLNFNTID